MSSSEVVPRTISDVRESRKEQAARNERPRTSRRDKFGYEVGKTSANHRKVIGISDAEANGSLAQT